ncbi:hypothetical protein BZL54_18750 [Burkholderia ubonensis subsp. mesacidophila]|uniref:Uncharacterized protein n=1 Tax=Burkholderia ubonensis subsp. mesacidophila TaxID=265293 RepID=A0A2A4FBS0_9BURK|nr:hypothetical protein BZL54_18750 [Burkholderia ubonensis subsp. mesacidophila]
MQIGSLLRSAMQSAPPSIYQKQQQPLFEPFRIDSTVSLTHIRSLPRPLPVKAHLERRNPIESARPHQPGLTQQLPKSGAIR